ncbi:hypothetical protein AYL99_03760 [Fonsecaea erecta]|uniref:C2H2-type domain-containing protein n=1 Tax=Fonsecaea erecta TaxID=1367422 RepID=A0A178ZP47_9EURO|nr:hypothetical protein AYL99_03760 [Fonsecaea erecta]OAP61557.1 hypothetical protein AYL99_03760 [Fonsecaea erecta]
MAIQLPPPDDTSLSMFQTLMKGFDLLAKGDPGSRICKAPPPKPGSKLLLQQHKKLLAKKRRAPRTSKRAPPHDSTAQPPTPLEQPPPRRSSGTQPSGSGGGILAQQTNTDQVPESIGEARGVSLRNDSTAGATLPNSAARDALNQQHISAQTTILNEEARTVPPLQNNWAQIRPLKQEARAVPPPQNGTVEASIPYQEARTVSPPQNGKARDPTPHQTAPTVPPSRYPADPVIRSISSSLPPNRTSGPSKRALVRQNIRVGIPSGEIIDLTTPSPSKEPPPRQNTQGQPPELDAAISPKILSSAMFGPSGEAPVEQNPTVQPAEQATVAWTIEIDAKTPPEISETLEFSPSRSALSKPDPMFTARERDTENSPDIASPRPSRRGEKDPFEQDTRELGTQIPPARQPEAEAPTEIASHQPSSSSESVSVEQGPTFRVLDAETRPDDISTQPFTQSIKVAYETSPTVAPSPSPISLKIASQGSNLTTSTFRSSGGTLRRSDSQVPNEGIALRAFFAWFVTCSRRPETVTSYLEELPSLLFNASRNPPVLDSIVRALSMTLYGIFRQSQSAVSRGKSIYESSRNMLSQLISDAKDDKVSSDELIVSLLLSEFCEACTCVENAQSASRILGAHVLITENDAGSILTREAIRVSDFLAALKGDQTLGEKGPWWATLQRGLAIEGSLSHWPHIVPSSWKPNLLENSIWSEDFVYGGKAHTYYDIQVASVWNCYRRIHIVLLDAIMNLASSTTELGGADCQRIKARAIKAMRELAIDICASVPFHVGTWEASIPASEIQYPSIGNHDADLIHRQNAYSCGWYLLLLPLSRLLLVKDLPAGQAEWIARQYSRICAIGDEQYHLPAQSFERLPPESLPSFAYSHAINLRNLVLVDPLNWDSSEREESVDLGSTGPREPATLSLDSRSNSVLTQTPAPEVLPLKRRRERDTEEDDGYFDADDDDGGGESDNHLVCWERCCHGRKFATIASLQQHRREQPGEAKIWDCEHCGISFTERTAWEEHDELRLCRRKRMRRTRGQRSRSRDNEGQAAGIHHMET